MLKNINPLLGPDLLHILRSMGHGDEITIVDANFPADSTAERLVRLDGHSATDVLSVVLSVLPLDEFVDCPAHRMEVVDDAEVVPPICSEFQMIIDTNETIPVSVGKIERYAFYERVKKSYAVIATGEERLYGNIILTKGIIRPK
jgi:L-fucose mutarotase